MTFDEEMQNALLESTEDVVGGPDLGRVLREGRRRRQRRTASMGVAAVAVVGLTVGTAYQLGRGPADRSSHDATQVTHAPAYHDFVPGTDIDEKLQAAVAEDLPGLGAAEDVGPLDDHGRDTADWRDAWYWVGTYRVSDGRLFVSTYVPRDRNDVTCRSYGHAPDEGQPDCTRTPLPSGGYVVADSFVGAPAPARNSPLFVFDTSYVATDGSLVMVNQQLPVDTWHQAVADRAYTPDQLRPLLTDPRLELSHLGG